MSVNTKEDIIRKVQGLMAKAADEAVASFESAMLIAKANEFMLKYAIAEAELKGTPAETKYGSIILWKGPRSPRLCYLFTSLLDTYFNVKPIEQNLRGGQRRLIIFGTNEACLWGQYVYEYLVEKFNQLWLHYQRYNPEITNDLRTSYYSGLYTGYCEKLDETKVKVSQDVGRNALVLLEDNLDAAVCAEFPKLIQKKAGSSRRLDSEALDAGIEAGRTIVINKALPRGQHVAQIANN